MESLYAVSIKGSMLYIKGDLTEKKCSDIENIAHHFMSDSINSEDCEVICQAFIKVIKDTHRIDLVQIPLKYIFRLK